MERKRHWLPQLWVAIYCLCSVILASSCQMFSKENRVNPNDEIEIHGVPAQEHITITLPGAEVVKVNETEKYVILECTLLPSEDKEAKVYRDGRVVGLLQLTDLRQGPFMVADILSGEIKENDEVRFKCAISSNLKEVLP